MTPETYLALPLDERVRVLKGRKLGIAGVGGLVDVVSRFLVRWAGLNPDLDVDLVNVGNTPAMLGAIRARRIDAFLLTPPIPFQVERDGIAIVYYSGPRGDLPALRELYSTVLVTAPAYAQRHPEIVRKMARSIAQANAYARQQREATAALMHRLFPQIEPEVVRQSTLAVIDALSPDARFSARAIAQQIRILMDGGFLSKKPIPAEEGTFWTNRFLD
ncbi:MAG: ABC transporter substrate-binding protein [Deltaproteobacteria bacterium]|nr:ABC transporter substrate-binding protein [Deltaproteobacteria bacterium]